MLYLLKKDVPLFEKCRPDVLNLPKKYDFGLQCYLKRNELPEEITITYAKWMSSKEDEKRFYGKMVYNEKTSRYDHFTTEGKKVSREEKIRIGKSKVKQAIDKLPESAWRTYTFRPREIIKKYNGKDPKGMPGMFGVKSPFPSFSGKRISINLIFQKDGSIRIEESFSWVNGKFDSYPG